MACTVRLAQPRELGLAFTLLPEMSESAVSPDTVFIAESPCAGILGAGFFSVKPHDTRCSGVRGNIFVLPSQRRKGIGSAILKEMRHALQRWGITFLHAWQAFPASQEFPFLHHAGFSRLRETSHFEADTERSLATCSELLTKMQASGRIPHDAKIIPFASADRFDVSRLYARHFGCAEADISLRFAYALSDQITRDLSCALTLQDQLIGFLLWKLDADRIPSVDLWISAPGFRTGWPAIVLLHASIDRMMKLQQRVGRFSCNDEARATLHIAKLIEARLRFSEYTYALQV